MGKETSQVCEPVIKPHNCQDWVSFLGPVSSPAGWIWCGAAGLKLPTRGAPPAGQDASRSISPPCAQLPAPRLSPPFPSSVGSAGLCPRSRSSWQGACTRPQGAGHKLTPCSEASSWGCFSRSSPGPLSLQGIRAAQQGSGHPISGSISFPFQAHLLVLFGAGQESILRAAPDGPGLLPALSPCRPGLDLCLAAQRQPAPAWFCAIFPW